MKTGKQLITLLNLLVVLILASACSSGPGNDPSENIEPTTAAAADLADKEMTSQEVEKMLAQREQEKWDKFFQGKYAEISFFYDDDFVNIAPGPAGTFRQNKQESDAALSQLPPMPGEYALTDFLFVHPGSDTVVVSYIVSAFFGSEYVTSVWAYREGEWKTVFYQGSTIPTAEADVTTGAQEADTAGTNTSTVSIPFFGRYLAELARAGAFDAILIKEDGTYAVDSGATGEYGTTGVFQIEDDLITFVDDDRVSVPHCQGDERSGTYQYVFTGNTLVLTNVNDTCAGRIAYFADRTWTR